MFFYFSKVAWFFLQPTALLIGMCAIGAFLLMTRFRRLATSLIGLATAGFMIAAFSPLSNALYLPLENRFQRPALTSPVDGIVVLGGSFDIITGEARGTAELNESAERLFEAIVLAQRFPNARIVFSGGSTQILASGMSEADMARRYFTAAGLDISRIIFEHQARNTAENASFTQALVKPTPSQRWLLVTSAFHMPRAIGCFRKIGWNVMPWPVDYRTGGPADLYRFHHNPAGGLRRTDKATREWIGLAAYWLTGRTDSLFPAP